MFLFALLSTSRPLLLFTSFTYVLASIVHLYMPQLFTHYLPTIIIICVMLTYILYVLWNNCFKLFYNCIIIWPLWIISV